MQGSAEDVQRGLHEQLRHFSNFQIQKRVFSFWKDHYVSTRERIEKIIRAMDFQEKWRQRQVLNEWIEFTVNSKLLKARELREHQLARRVISKWRIMIAQHNRSRSQIAFNRMRQHCFEQSIARQIRRKHENILIRLVWRKMKDYSIYSFENELRMHEKCVKLYKMGLKRKYFDFLKKEAQIRRDVEYMRSTALESRRFYLFKLFFQPWKKLTHKRKIHRICHYTFKEQQDLKSKRTLFYQWITSSIHLYQARVLHDRIYLSKAFRALHIQYMKHSKRREKVQFLQGKRLISFKKNVLLEWFHYARAKVTRTRKCEAFLSMKNLVMQENAFLAFKKISEKTHRKQKGIYIAIKHGNLSRMKKFFDLWNMVIDFKQHTYLNKLQASRHCEKMFQRLYFKSLQIYMYKKKVLRDAQGFIEMQKKQRDTGKVFESWKDGYLEISNRENMAIEKSNMKTKLGVFVGWLTWSSRRAERRKKVVQNLVQSMHREKLRIMSGWSKRARENRLGRYQKQDAIHMTGHRLKKKGLAALISQWETKKRGKLLQLRREMSLRQHAFYLWVYLKAQEERITRFGIGKILEKVSKLLKQWKSWSSRRKKQRELVKESLGKRNKRVLRLGLSVWQFFMRMQEEKQVYRMSLFRYSLLKRGRLMVIQWKRLVDKRLSEEEKTLKIQQNHSNFEKKWVLRIMKEEAQSELNILVSTRQMRHRFEKDNLRRLFQGWARHSLQKSIVKRAVRTHRELVEYQLLQSVCLGWEHLIQTRKRDRLLVEEHIAYKQCVMLVTILQQWKRVSRVQTKESKKTQRIKANIRISILSNSFYMWAESFQDKRFSDQTEKMQSFLEKRIAFGRFVHQYRVHRKDKMRDILAVRHHVTFQLKRALFGWRRVKNQTKHEHGVETLSSLLGKQIGFHRVLKCMRVLHVQALQRRESFSHCIRRMMSKSFGVMKQYAIYKKNKIELEKKYALSIGIGKVARCFNELKLNVDSRYERRLQIGKYERRKTRNLKARLFKHWKSGYQKRRHEMVLIRPFLKDSRKRRINMCFQEMHRHTLESQYKTKQIKRAIGFDNQKTLKSFFQQWRVINDEEKLQIQKNNIAFCFYATRLKQTALRACMQFISTQQRQNTHLYSGVLLRSEKLKRFAFKSLHNFYIGRVKLQIIRKRNNLLRQQFYLRKWSRIHSKCLFRESAIQTLVSMASLVVKRQCFRKIETRSSSVQTLQKIAGIYTYNLKFNMLKVFLMNMLMHRRVERFQKDNKLALQQSAFYVLQQYAAFKKQRNLKIITLLQLIHTALSNNISHHAFFALKKRRYLTALKRATLIRYANHLKFISFFSLRKYLARMRSKRQIEQMVDIHQKRLALSEWKNLFLSGEATKHRQSESSPQSAHFSPSRYPVNSQSYEFVLNKTSNLNQMISPSRIQYNPQTTFNTNPFSQMHTVLTQQQQLLPNNNTHSSSSDFPRRNTTNYPVNTSHINQQSSMEENSEFLNFISPRNLYPQNQHHSMESLGNYNSTQQKMFLQNQQQQLQLQLLQQQQQHRNNLQQHLPNGLSHHNQPYYQQSLSQINQHQQNTQTGQQNQRIWGSASTLGIQSGITLSPNNFSGVSNINNNSLQEDHRLGSDYMIRPINFNNQASDHTTKFLSNNNVSLGSERMNRLVNTHEYDHINTSMKNTISYKDTPINYTGMGFDRMKEQTNNNNKLSEIGHDRRLNQQSGNVSVGSDGFAISLNNFSQGQDRRNHLINQNNNASSNYVNVIDGGGSSGATSFNSQHHLRVSGNSTPLTNSIDRNPIITSTAFQEHALSQQQELDQIDGDEKNIQQQRLIKYHAADLENIEEHNNEENSQSIISRSQIDVSHKVSPQKSGVVKSIHQTSTKNRFELPNSVPFYHSANPSYSRLPNGSLPSSTDNVKQFIDFERFDSYDDDNAIPNENLLSNYDSEQQIQQYIQNKYKSLINPSNK